MHAIPGGPFDSKSSKCVPLPEAVRAHLLKAYGLDKPIWVQYARYMWGVLHLDFGISFDSPSETVAQLIGRTWKVTAHLGLLTAGLAFSTGLLLGLLSAAKYNTWIDHLITFLSVNGIVFPNFVVGVVLMVIFSIFLGWLPTGGWEWGEPKYWIMPVMAYALAPTAYIARYTRVALVDTLGEDYIRTARSKGVSELRVMLVHAFKNALIPIITIGGYIFADLLTGSLFIETIFRVPGLGRFFTTSIFARDYPVIMATTLLLAAIMGVINLITDISYVWVDPRIRLGERSH